MTDTKISSDRIENLWRSRKTIIEGVLPARGYPIPKNAHLTYEEFVEWVGEDNEDTVRENMTIVYEKLSKNPERIIVIWSKDPKLGTNMREVYQKIKKQECTRAIIIVDHSVTHWAKPIIQGLRQKKIYINIYTLKESLFNVMDHRLVPKHIICSAAEKKEIMMTYAINKSTFPHIKSTDPIVRHFGVLRGQLLKIIRQSDTQTKLEAISYRLVV